MDPNETHRRMIELAYAIADGTADEYAAAELAELVIALDVRVGRGGFLPNAWTR